LLLNCGRASILPPQLFCQGLIVAAILLRLGLPGPAEGGGWPARWRRMTTRVPQRHCSSLWRSLDWSGQRPLHAGDRMLRTLQGIRPRREERDCRIVCPPSA